MTVTTELIVFQGYDYLTMETQGPMGASALEDLGVDGWKLVTVVALHDRKYIKYLTYFIKPKRVSADAKMAARILKDG